jgi:ABC-type polysaccharide/polyol phosphate transport system ATPase subunit
MGNSLISLTDVGFTYKTLSGLFSVEKYQALKSINLDVFPGETLGVIGSNGSGKSTLLKVLARIYWPDEGSIVFNAKKISLLSLALGFDARLSGLDNAVFSSMLLGATLNEAKQKVKGIIDFSELGEFASHPVRTYSSGMRARLGFSIALHMQADVLLIDEALAVGDARFRAKSEQAIVKKVTSAQTVVLVSHSADQINRLCDRAVWIENGEIVLAGETDLVTKKYAEAN